MGKKISVWIESDELVEALDGFIKEFPRLSRSEAVECMLFYVFSHEECLEDVANALEGIDEDEDEDESEDEDENEDETEDED